MRHRPALLPLLALASLCSAPAGAGDSSPEATARTLLEVSGLEATLRALEGSVGQQAAAQLGSGDQPIATEERAELARVYASAFDAQRIHQRVVEALLEDFDAAKAARVVAWYDSPLGRKLRAAAAEQGTAEGQAQLALWIQGIRLAPPQPQRVELARRLDEATGATHQFTTLMGTLSLAMVRGLATAMPPAHPVAAPEAELAATLDTVRAELEPLMERQALLVLLYSTRSLSDAELGAYVEEAEAPAARWFNEASFRGLERGFSEASRALGKALGEWIPSRLDDGALAARRDEGNGYGTGRIDRECVDSALERDAACGDFACHFEASSFMEGCLEAATATASLCVEVPNTSEVGATVQWRIAGCARLGRSDNFCRHLLHRVQEHCHTKPGATGA